MKTLLLLKVFDLWKGINACGNANAGANCEPPGKDDLARLIVNISEIALALVGTVALLFLIVGGFQYITSAGNPDNVAKAKSTILYSIIGLILAILSYAIIKFIIEKVI